MKDNIYNGTNRPEWPYPIKYDVENRVDVDVLVIGGGIAGSMAGLMAARRGVRVAVVDKSPIDISGCGGAGIDHYGGVVSNPDSPVDIDELMNSLHGDKTATSDDVIDDKDTGIFYDHTAYINSKGAWDNLLELEKLGLHFRDETNDFVGAPFRDDKTGVMYAYDYVDKSTIRLRGGVHIKKYMKEGLLKEKNVELFERVMITSLLTENGRPGTRVVGATGVNEQTGEFYVFHAPSVIITTAGVAAQGTGTWTFNMEMFGNGYKNDPRDTGDGIAMAWKAGVEMNSEEQFGQHMYHSPFGWPWYSVGTSDNTWHPCTLVDNKGKKIPWVDAYGEPISTIEERTLPPKTSRPATLITMHVPSPKIDPELIRSGEYELPLWADLSDLPEYERRGIWGLMIGNEGKTRFSIYDYFNKAGFNPNRDMLQVPVMDPEAYANVRKDWYQGEPNNNKFWKADTLRGIAVDWNQMTNIPGLFSAGAEIGQAGSACGASGAYAGNRAAEYAMENTVGDIDEEQVKKEKERVYAPVARMDDPDANVSWKELWMGMNRVMQQDCGDYRTEVLYEHGLMWLDSIKKLEMQQTYARNPHELSRVLEVENRITVAEVYLYQGIANCRAEAKGEGKGMLMYNKLIDSELITTYREQEWWLKPPYAPTYLENYNNCRAAENINKSTDPEVNK